MFIMSDRMYNGAKRLVQIILPAFSALYFGLASIWGLPSPDKVVGSVAVLTTFVGVCIGISNKTYTAMDGSNVGTLVITEKPDGMKTISLEVNDDTAFEDLETKDSVSFKVNKEVIKQVAPKKATRAAKKT
jgi:hypothetical protein